MKKKGLSLSLSLSLFLRPGVSVGPAEKTKMDLAWSQIKKPDNIAEQALLLRQGKERGRNEIKEDDEHESNRRHMKKNRIGSIVRCELNRAVLESAVELYCDACLCYLSRKMTSQQHSRDDCAV